MLRTSKNGQSRPFCPRHSTFVLSLCTFHLAKFVIWILTFELLTLYPSIEFFLSITMEKKTLKQKIERVQEQELNKILEEGYKARKQESLSIAEEYLIVDIEGWDEY